MSYCRFFNTSLDLADCLETLEDAESFTELNLSEEEAQSMTDIAVFARKYLERYTELQEQAEYEFARTQR
jgi:hypothetical protein